MPACQANRPGRELVCRGWSQVPGEKKLDRTVTTRVTDSFDLKHHSVGIASYRGEIQLFSEAKANQISRPGIHEEVSLGKNY